MKDDMNLIFVGIKLTLHNGKNLGLIFLCFKLKLMVLVSTQCMLWQIQSNSESHSTIIFCTGKKERLSVTVYKIVMDSFKKKNIPCLICMDSTLLMEIFKTMNNNLNN